MNEYKALPCDDIEVVPKHRPLMNTGGLHDVPTGKWTEGLHGEWILNGGTPIFTGYAGPPNSFKSTMALAVQSAIMARVIWCFPTRAIDHDSESTATPSRVDTIASAQDAFKDRSVTDEGIFQLTDKGTHFGDDFFEMVKNFIKKKSDNKKDYMVELPLLDRDGKRMKVMGMSSTLIDTLTYFQTSGDIKIQDENQVGSSGRNIAAARAQLTKASMLSEIPRLSNLGAHWFIMTAHISRKVELGGGPFSAPPETVLQQLKNGDALKGTSKDFAVLTQVLWQTAGLKPLIHKESKAPEYPKDAEDDRTPSMDLMLVGLRALRNKYGLTGSTIPAVVSQRDGWLPSLSEYYYLRNATGSYGITGTERSFSLDLYDVKLSRTKLRQKIDSDPKLQRALNITAELRQMIEFMPQYRHLYCTAEELFNDIKQQGFDWDQILEGTRGWYTYFNDDHPIKFLSTMDLLRMRKGLYKPYWMQ